MNHDFCRLIVMESPVGYAYHQIILDDKGVPCDYIILEANRAFETLTGLKLENVKGKKITEILPGIKETDFDWIGAYGEVALTGNAKEFEQYSEPLKKWFRVKVHSIEKGFFGTYFFNITNEKHLAESAEMFLQQTSEKINYQAITDTILQISEARYGIFNIYDDSGEEYISVAFSGVSSIISEVSDILGFNIVGKKWRHDPVREKKIAMSTVTKFTHLYELAENRIPGTAILLIEKTFGLGPVYIVKITKDSKMIGDFTLFFEEKKVLQNQGLVELYTKMTGMFISKKKSEEKLKKIHERYMLAVKGNHDGIWDWDMVTDELFLSERWKNILGYADSELESAHGLFKSLLHPDDKNRVSDYLKSYLRGDFEHYNIEFRMRHKNGNYRWINARGEALLDKNGKPYRMAGSHTDITEKKEMEKRLEEFASIDDLTGIWNRRYFFEMGKAEFLRSKRYKASFALIMIDVDHFKTINDTYGHAAGDEVLKKITAVLKKNLRDVDILARLGGEEFAVLLPNTETPGAEIVAERLRKAVESALFVFETREMPATISIGIADHKNSDSLDELLKNADSALYLAKSQGRNTVRTYGV